MAYSYDDWQNHRWRIATNPKATDLGIGDKIAFTHTGGITTLSNVDCVCGGSHGGGDWKSMGCAGPYKGSNYMASGQTKSTSRNIQIESTDEGLTCRERDIDPSGGVCWTAVEGG